MDAAPIQGWRHADKPKMAHRPGPFVWQERRSRVSARSGALPGSSTDP